ncbi:MAG: DUF362 domain-containing protein [Clostridia bacterium]|nr:DUF362 domain-containing protein [Clostridia bacterium]
MKKVRLYLIYGIIGILCIAGLFMYFSDASQNSKASQKLTADSSKTSSSKDPEHPVVAIAQGEDYAKTTREAIDKAGGLKDLIKKDSTVLIKPNLCGTAKFGSPIITDYRVVQEIVTIVKELGAKRVIIAEGPITGNAFAPSIMKQNGFDNIKDVEFVDINKLGRDDCYEIKAENSVTGKSFFIPKIYMDADVVIGVPKLKTHFQPDAVVSLSLKNLYGVPSGKIYGTGYKAGLHSMGLKESIVDLNKIRKPDFNVIDGIVGGEGNGPLNNTPVKSNVIIAGSDPVAVDTVALTFMGFDVSKVPHVKLASDEGVGVSDLTKIQIVGPKLDDIKMSFKRY